MTDIAGDTTYGPFGDFERESPQEIYAHSLASPCYERTLEHLHTPDECLVRIKDRLVVVRGMNSKA